MIFIKAPSARDLSGTIKFDTVARVFELVPPRARAFRIPARQPSDLGVHPMSCLPDSESTTAARKITVRVASPAVETVFTATPQAQPAVKTKRRLAEICCGKSLQTHWTAHELRNPETASRPVSPDLWPLRIMWPLGTSCFDFLFQGNSPQIRERVIGLLSAPTLTEADRRANRLVRLPLRHSQKRVVDAVTALKHSGRDAGWGEGDWIDELRLHEIRSKILLERPRLFDDTKIEWAGSLRWLGDRISEFKHLAIDEDTRRIMTVAIAAASNYRSAIDFLTRARTKNSQISPNESHWASACGLRAILEGGVTSEIVRLLIPPSTSGDICRSPDCWSSFKMALLRIKELPTGPIAVVLAEFLSGIFRNCLASMQRRLFHTSGRLLPFDCPFDSADFRQAQSVLSAVAGTNWTPWNEEYTAAVRKLTAVEIQCIDADVRRLLGPRVSVAPFIYMNRSLLASALFVLFDKDWSAETELATCDHSEMWSAPRQAIKACIGNKKVRADENKYLSASILADPHLESLLCRIKDTVEPNVLLGTPIWSIETDLSKWALRLTKTNNALLFRRLRTFLSRYDLREELERFLMLTLNQRTSFTALFRRISECAPPRSDSFWRDSFDQIAEASFTLRNVHDTSKNSIG